MPPDVPMEVKKCVPGAPISPVKRYRNENPVSGMRSLLVYPHKDH